ncbi:DUF6090 family protein [Winogradskyella vincentii]|uniref:Uncharacterized protein n=1 Tax=Winogradskyella vincentii TaxID=2877122 RepID=A0ABS7Y3B4_9FLAO|nr:DUF6090 family protein [Winogradskyella vincentii]MCA0154420.1 hypothetical protein [Winogradskyella vincentii]
MIKFFRHIRRSLIQENKMGKYFKYAIGEILLVVIGILIALQINNWNESQKESEELRNIFIRIEQDFKNSAVEINDGIEEMKLASIYTNAILLNQVSEDTLYLDEMYFRKHAFSFTGFPDIKINETGIELLKNKIQNNYDLNTVEIERLLNLYTELLYEIHIDHSDLYYHYNELKSYIVPTTVRYNYKFKGQKNKIITMMLNDEQFKSYLYEFHNLRSIYLTKLQEFQEDGEEIIAKIKMTYNF